MLRTIRIAGMRGARLRSRARGDGVREDDTSSPQLDANPSASAAGSPATAARAAERPRRNRYRSSEGSRCSGWVKTPAAPDGARTSRVTPRLPLQTEVARNRYTLVLRDVNVEPEQRLDYLFWSDDPAAAHLLELASAVNRSR